MIPVAVDDLAVDDLAVGDLDVGDLAVGEHSVFQPFLLLTMQFLIVMLSLLAKIRKYYEALLMKSANIYNVSPTFGGVFL